MNGIIDDVLIRDFRRSDLDDVLDVAHLSFAKEFEATGFDPDHIKKMIDQMFGILGRIFQGFSKLFGKEPFKMFVAEIDRRVVGTIMVTKRGKVGYISTVMVHPTYRRKGIARKLMTSALDYIQKKKMNKAVLHVVSMNVSAKSLYAKLGFKEFEKIAYFVGNIDYLLKAEDVKEIQIRNFQKDDIMDVFDLKNSSEDPKHLKIFDFKKNDLKTPVIKRVFHFFAEKKIVALDHNSIVGYAQAIYTTANEAGKIRSVHLYPKDRSKGIEEMLINAAVNEIRKVGTKKILVTASLERPELISAIKRLGFEKHLEMEGMVLEL